MSDAQPHNATQRFSSRVENDIKYHPRYPQEIISALCDEFGLSPYSVIADADCATGIFAEILHSQKTL